MCCRVHETSERLKELRQENEELRANAAVSEDWRKQAEKQLKYLQKTSHQSDSEVIVLQTQVNGHFVLMSIIVVIISHWLIFDPSPLLCIGIHYEFSKT